MPAIEYRPDARDVLTAARSRMAAVFDDFEQVVVSVSGGKDSAVVRRLALDEADRRGRRVALFFLDQEAEYQSTAEIMAQWMHDPRVDPLWYQVPLRLTNATSHADYWLRAWDPDARDLWMREKDPVAIHRVDDPYPDRFYDFFAWNEGRATVPTAHVVGLRSRESFNRFRAVTKSAGHRDWEWSTSTRNPLAARVYPIYDWDFGDVWKFIADEGVPYNTHYDRMFAKYGANVSKMRVSNLIHEQAFRCLVDLQEFEPDTYDRLVRRLGGVHCAALYGAEAYVLDAKKLPAAFATWRAYRDYLLVSTPLDRVDRFRTRFASQPKDDETARRQVRQILTNDWENSVGVGNTKLDALRARWWDRL